MQPVIFIVGFLIILGLFIRLIMLISKRLSDNIPPAIFDQVERIIISGIVIGVIGMFQPWIFLGYKYGFMLLLFSTLALIVWSHITPAATRYHEEAMPETTITQL